MTATVTAVIFPGSPTAADWTSFGLRSKSRSDYGWVGSVGWVGLEYLPAKNSSVQPVLRYRTKLNKFFIGCTGIFVLLCLFFFFPLTVFPVVPPPVGNSYTFVLMTPPFHFYQFHLWCWVLHSVCFQRWRWQQLSKLSNMVHNRTRYKTW